MHNPERATLGGLLLSDVSLERVAIDVGLKPEHFYHVGLGAIWEAMQKVHLAGDRIDVHTVGRHSKHNVELLLDELQADCPNVSNVPAYAATVVKDAEWRKVKESGHELVASAESKDDERRSQAEAQLVKAPHTGNDTTTADAMERLLFEHLEGKEPPAYATPFPELDEFMCGGLRPGEMTIIGGWTSHGKSVLIDQLLNSANESGAKTHLYVNEMTDTQRGLRELARRSGVSARKVTSPKKYANPDDLRKIANAIPGVMKHGMTSIGDWTPVQVAQHIRFNKWDVCGIDLLSLMVPEESKDISALSRVLNAAAKATNCHIIGVVQFNEARAQSAYPPKPTKRDIRGSGMIKNDAENVILVYRKGDDEDRPTSDSVIILDKCRNGEQGKLVPVSFDDQRLVFDPIERY